MERDVGAGQLVAGKYRVEKVLGRGGMGVVMLALHEQLNQRVALKFLTDDAYQQPEAVTRFLREARAAVQIQSEHVARVMDVGTLDSGAPYMVMEYLRGFDLKEVSTRRGPLPVSEAVDFVLQACDAVAEAHSLGIVHRDLKPGNIFISEDSSIKVLDFGMSKLGGSESLTQDGYTLGTPEYMAPEQCIGAPVDPRTDLYAFGVLMYEALTGDLPIRGRNRRELLELHQREIPRPLRVARPDLQIPEALDAAVMSCLRKRAAERPASARELERLLAAVPREGLLYEYPPSVTRQRLTQTSSANLRFGD